MICLTSFSPKGYEIYGKRFLESFVENWPCKVVVYYEELPDFKHEKVIYKPLMEVEGIEAFLKYCSLKPIFSGQLPGGYNYNYDAEKFCKKVFAQFDALKEHSGKVIWLDADTKTLKPVTQEFIDGLFAGAGLVYLGREGLHCESGFVGFDNEYPGFDEFFNKYIECYRSGKIFNLNGWHDCYALDWAIKESNIKTNNLSSWWKTGDSYDVFSKSVLSPFMTHYKGNRKYVNTPD